MSMISPTKGNDSAAFKTNELNSDETKLTTNPNEMDLENNECSQVSADDTIYATEGALEAAEKLFKTTEDDVARGILSNLLASVKSNPRLKIETVADLGEGLQKIHNNDKTPHCQSEKPDDKNRSSTLLSNSYSEYESLEDLDKGIDVARNIIQVLPKVHEYQVVWMDHLARRLTDRYLRMGQSKDLEEAIVTLKDILNVMPQNHPIWPSSMNNLANLLDERSSNTGALSDLEWAIKAARQATDLASQDNSEQATLANNLGILLNNKASRTGAMEDHDEAIQAAKRAINLTEKEDPNWAVWMTNLGTLLGNRYSVTGAMIDLDEAIQVAR